jgi:hypothetical protein
MTEKKIDIRDYIEIIDDAKSGSANNFFSSAIINDKKALKQVTDNTLKTINADIQKQMIADMGNVFNDSATFAPIKQWLTSEHNIREMLAHGGLENEGFDITLSSHYSKDSSKTFWVETSQGSTYADFNFDLYYNLEVSDDTIIDLVSSEISKIDLTTYIDKLDKKKIYQIKNYRHKLYFDSKLLDDKKIGRALRIYMLQHNVKQRSLHDLANDFKLDAVQVYANSQELQGNLNVLPQFDSNRMIDFAKTRISKYIDSFNKDLYVSKGWKYNHLIIEYTDEGSYQAVDNVENISVSALTGYLLRQPAKVAKEITERISKSYRDEIERVILDAKNIQQSAFVATVKSRITLFGTSINGDFEFPNEFVGAILAGGKQLKDVIPYEKLYDLVGENIKDLFGQYLEYGPGIGVDKLLKLLKTEITYDFEPVDDIEGGGFDNVTATMRLTFASTKFDSDSLAKMKDTINKLYKTKLPEFLRTSSFAEGILQKYVDDEDLMKGQVVKNVPLVKLEYPDFEGVDGYDLRLSKTGDNGIYVDFFIDTDLFSLSDMIYDMTDYKWISETLVKEFTERADENGLIVENFKVDSSSDLIIYGDIKAKHVRKMYQDGSFRQLTFEIDKQMSEIKKEVYALQDKLIDHTLETVTLELKNTLCSMQKFPEYNFAVYLDAPSLEISKELNVVLQNTGSTDIYAELIANNITINVPRGLLDKYNVSMNDFTDVKAFINKNYSFLFNVDAVQTKYYYMIMKKLDNFCSTVNANQREFGLKFIKLSGLDSGNSELRNIGDGYSIRTFKIQDYVFTLDNINVNETYDKVKLSTSKFVSVGYSVVLDK